MALTLLAVSGYSDASHPAGRSRIAGTLLGVDEQQKTRSLIPIELASRAVSDRGLAKCVTPLPRASLIVSWSLSLIVGSISFISLSLSLIFFGLSFSLGGLIRH